MTQPAENKISILAVDDNPNALEVIRRQLTPAGHTIHTCRDVAQAVSFLNQTPVDLVITDNKMPRQSGMDLITHLRQNAKETAIIMITGYASIDGAVEAVKKGAEEYLAKPFTQKELLTVVDRVIERLMHHRALMVEDAPPLFDGMVGTSPAMRQVHKLIAKAAKMNANVLISGESGTGKELVSRAIHYIGPRAAAPFVAVNCTAIPESLLESELFGHVKGAFTGANSSRNGFFQMADGGTIFLDEIGDASLNLQAKLLRTIQTKEFFKVGAGKVSRVDTRIIAATHKDLPALIKKKLFREDLYYRLNVVNIHIPSLTERREDIPKLINHFLTIFCREMDCPQPTFTDQALGMLINYNWPGNIRELENLIQRLLVTADQDTIDIGDLPENMRTCICQGRSLARTLKEVEAEHMLAVLQSVGGNKTRAAEILGIDRKTLREKLKPLSLDGFKE